MVYFLLPVPWEHNLELFVSSKVELEQILRCSDQMYGKVPTEEFFYSKHLHGRRNPFFFPADMCVK